MLIDIPCHLAFNTDGSRTSHRPDGERIFTMRYDIHHPDAPAQFTDHYPPREDATWLTDSSDVLLGLLTSGADKRIRIKALACPSDYCADATEGDRLQEVADAARRVA